MVCETLPPVSTDYLPRLREMMAVEAAAGVQMDRDHGDRVVARKRRDALEYAIMVLEAEKHNG